MWINLRGINDPLSIYSTKIDLINQYLTMIVQFNRNIQFTKLIKAEGHLREFNFRKVNGLHEELFTVDVSDDRGNRIMFKMRKEGNEWFIDTDHPIPDWVRNYIPRYNEAIEEELRVS
jgi:hypothetical protein